MPDFENHTPKNPDELKENAPKKAQVQAKKGPSVEQVFDTLITEQTSKENDPLEVKVEKEKLATVYEEAKEQAVQKRDKKASEILDHAFFPAEQREKEVRNIVKKNSGDVLTKDFNKINVKFREKNQPELRFSPELLSAVQEFNKEFVMGNYVAFAEIAKKPRNKDSQTKIDNLKTAYNKAFEAFLPTLHEKAEAARKKIIEETSRESLAATLPEEEKEDLLRTENGKAFLKDFQSLDFTQLDEAGIDEQVKKLQEKHKVKEEELKPFIAESKLRLRVIRSIEQGEFEPAKLLQLYRKQDASSRALQAQYEKTIAETYEKGFANSNLPESRGKAKAFANSRRDFYHDRAQKLMESERVVSSTRFLTETQKQDPELFKKYIDAARGDEKAFDEWFNAIQGKSYFQNFQKEQSLLADEAKALFQTRVAIQQEKLRTTIGISEKSDHWKVLRDQMNQLYFPWSLKFEKNGTVYADIPAKSENSEKNYRFNVSQEKDKIYVQLDQNASYQDEAFGNYFPEADFKKHPIDALDEIRQDIEVQEFLVRLSNRMVSLPERHINHFRSVFKTYENRVKIIEGMKENAKVMNISWQDAFDKVMDLLMKPEFEEVFYTGAPIEIQGETLIVGKWFKKVEGGVELIHPEIIKENLRQLAALKNKK